MIHLFDSNFKVVAFVPSNAIMDGSSVVETWGEAPSLKATMTVTKAIAENKDVLTYAVVLPDGASEPSLYSVQSAEISDGKFNLVGVDTFYSDMQHLIKEVFVVESMSPIAILESILENTEWFVEGKSTQDKSARYSYKEEYENRYNLVTDLLKKTGYHLRTFVELTSDNNIGKKYVQMIKPATKWESGHLEQGVRGVTVSYDVDKDNIPSALIGRGATVKKETTPHTRPKPTPSDENEGATVNEVDPVTDEELEEDEVEKIPSERVMFTDVVWSKANGDPANKAKGKDSIEDPELTKIVGKIDGGKLRRAVYDDSDIDDPKDLIMASWLQLQEYKASLIRVKATGSNLESFELGQLINVVDSDSNINAQVPVSSVSRDITDKTKSKIELGKLKRPSMLEVFKTTIRTKEENKKQKQKQNKNTEDIKHQSRYNHQNRDYISEYGKANNHNAKIIDNHTFDIKDHKENPVKYINDSPETKGLVISKDRLPDFGGGGSGDVDDKWELTFSDKTKHTYEGKVLRKDGSQQYAGILSSNTAGDVGLNKEFVMLAFDDNTFAPPDVPYPSELNEILDPVFKGINGFNPRNGVIFFQPIMTDGDIRANGRAYLNLVYARNVTTTDLTSYNSLTVGGINPDTKVEKESIIIDDGNIKLSHGANMHGNSSLIRYVKDSRGNFIQVGGGILVDGTTLGYGLVSASGALPELRLSFGKDSSNRGTLNVGTKGNYSDIIEVKEFGGVVGGVPSENIGSPYPSGTAVTFNSDHVNFNSKSISFNSFEHGFVLGSNRNKIVIEGNSLSGVLGEPKMRLRGNIRIDGTNRTDPSKSTLRIVSMATTSSEANVYTDYEGGLYRVVSAKKYKKNIKRWKGNYKALLDIKPSTWNMKGTDDNKVYFGAIADDFHDLGLTDVVRYDADGTVDGLDYTRIPMYMIPILKEHEDKIQKQNKRIAKLEKELQDIRSFIEKMK